MRPSRIFCSSIVTICAVGLAGVLSASVDGISSSSGRVNSPYWTQLMKRSRSEVQPVQLCGYRLLEAVRGLCRGNFAGYTRRSDPAMTGGFMEDSVVLREPSSNSVDLNSESVSSSGGDSYWEAENSYNDQEMWPHSPKSLTLKVLAESKGHQRFRRSIIDECCKKSCTVSQMVKYCARN